MVKTALVRIDEEQLAGIKQKKLEMALQKFAHKEATAWKAARLADIPLTSFFDVLKERGIL